MTVYIDRPRRYDTPLRHKEWSHLACDSDDLTELHALAASIGLKREWFQEHATTPHYDVVKAKYERAIAAGAVPVDSQTLVRKCSKLFRQTPSLERVAYCVGSAKGLGTSISSYITRVQNVAEAASTGAQEETKVISLICNGSGRAHEE